MYFLKNVIALAVLCCFVHSEHFKNINFGNEWKLAQTALKSANPVDHVEAESTSNLRTAASMNYNMILTSFYSDSGCTVTQDSPFLWIAPNQCVPNTDGGNSYKLTISGSKVTEKLFTDLACQIPASSNTTVTYTTSKGSSVCVATTIPATTYITIKLLKLSPGQLPTGSQLGTYNAVFTSATTCNAASTSNIANGFVAAQPFSIIGSSGDSPFGIPFNQALALTCSADGFSVIVDAWKTKMKNGTLAVVPGGLPSMVSTVPLGDCYPVEQGTAYYYRMVCI